MGANLTRSSIFAVLGGIVFAAIWSGSFVATKVALTDASPLLLAGIRLSAAGAMLLALTFPAARRLWRDATPRARLAIVGSSVLSQAFYLGATYTALSTLPTGMVTVIVATLPLVSVPIAVGVLGERSARADFIAAGIGVLGSVIVVIGRDPGALSGAHSMVLPLLGTVLSVVALATGNALVKPHISYATIMPTCAIQMTLAGLLLMTVVGGFGSGAHFTLSGHSLGALAYLVVIGSIAGTFIWYRVLTVFSAKSASMFFLFTPIFGLAIAWTLLGETMTIVQLSGAGVVCASILFRGVAGATPDAIRLPRKALHAARVFAPAKSGSLLGVVPR